MRVIPKYGIEVEAQVKGRLCFSGFRRGGGIEMSSANDFLVLMERPETLLNCWNVLRRTGMETRGDVMNNNISSANNAQYETPLMSGFDLMAMAKDSIVIVKISGERGQPCLVPFLIFMLSE